MPMGFLPPLPTGLADCFDARGARIDCTDSLQDAAVFPEIVVPHPRFAVHDEELVEDRLTGLVWTRNANPADFPMPWREGLDLARAMNARNAFGFSDWRIPNRRELRSLLSHGAKNPALPEGHPFENVLENWVWTSTTSAMAPAYAWRVHLAGARMFYGKKTEDSLVWPVRGESGVLPRTGQMKCFNRDGALVHCAKTGQDGETRFGAPWPEPRFSAKGEAVRDNLTGLTWTRNADLADGFTDWEGALARVERLSAETGQEWRLPNINELESLCDCSRHSPALPEGHPFQNPREAYWSSTTSFYEPDWAYCLYLHKGAVGVGHKPGAEFSVWAVR